MQKDSKIFDDLARMASGAAGLALDVKREIEAAAAAQVEKLLSRMSLVKREEFEVVRDMVRKAREEQEKLQARLAELEQREKRPR